MRHLPLLLVAALFPVAAFAAEPAAYAGLQDRPIKSLSAQQIGDLRAGRGLGLSLPAELNGYPGPKHVLELAEALQLTPEQRRDTERLVQSMTAEAVVAGEAVIAAERRLDALFAEHRASAESVEEAAHDAALAQGRLRAVHLRHHVAMQALLTPPQVEAYDRLRGYAGGRPPEGQPHLQHHHR